LTKQFTLGKKERLKSRKQIEQLFKQGKSFAIYPFKIYYVLNSIQITPRPENSTDSRLWTPPSAKATGGKPDSRLLFGVGAGTRNFKKAVDRNRIKRLTREAYRLQKNALQQKLLETENVQVIASGKENDVQKSATAYMFHTTADNFLSNGNLVHEVFGPASIHVTAATKEELFKIARKLPGQLTISIWGTEEDLSENTALVQELELKAGRIIFNNVPTGVEVTHAMVHGGPYPATTDSRSTSVGTTAIYRFTRAVCYQNSPQELLPDALKNENPLHIWRQVNGAFLNGAIN